MAGVEAFDEMGPAGDRARALYGKVKLWLDETPPELLASRRAQAEYMFRRIGITFGVYGDKDAAERLIPFDIVPRLLSRGEWGALEAGLTQRARALREAGFERAPFPAGQQARNDVKRDKALGRVLVAVDAEGDADAAEHVFGLGAP